MDIMDGMSSFFVNMHSCSGQNDFFPVLLIYMAVMDRMSVFSFCTQEPHSRAENHGSCHLYCQQGGLCFIAFYLVFCLSVWFFCLFVVCFVTPRLLNV